MTGSQVQELKMVIVRINSTQCHLTTYVIGATLPVHVYLISITLTRVLDVIFNILLYLFFYFNKMGKYKLQSFQSTKL